MKGEPSRLSVQSSAPADVFVRSSPVLVKGLHGIAIRWHIA